jgi:anti-anti-sigma factor
MDSDHATIDRERAVDQLVDELSSRVWRLKVLIEGASASPAATERADAVRAAANALVREMLPSRAGSEAAADQLMAALWSDGTGDIGDDWWGTPLGRVVQQVRAMRDAPDPADLCAQQLPLSVDVSSDGARVTAALSGEFDLAARSAVTAAIRPHLGGAVTVDLAAIEFLDSAALHCLVDLRREAADRGGQLTIRNPSRVATRVLQIAGLGAIVGGDLTGTGRAVGRGVD